MTWLPSAARALTIYVAADATGANDGSSWADAFTDLQSALAVAATGDQLWVKAGTYKPSPGLDYTATFELVDGVALYGGFSGTESALAERDWVTHVTTLDGYLGLPPDPPPEDCGHVRHVVTAAAVDSTTILDGVTVRNGGNFWGYSCEGALLLDGGGMYVVGGSPTIANVRFEWNFASRNGAGLYIEAGDARLRNVTFDTNSAGGQGGGLYTTGGSKPLLEDVTFTNNYAVVAGGGYKAQDFPALSKVQFLQNTAANGGGMAGSASFDDVTFFQNLAEHGSGGGLVGGGTLANVRFLGNTAREEGGGMAGQGTLTKVSFIGNGVANFYSSGGGLSGSGVLTDVLFEANSALRAGGGMYDWSGNGVLTNVLFVNNHAQLGGGLFHGIWTPPKQPTGVPQLVNVTFTGNTADLGGGGMYNKGISPTLSNCILWGDVGPNGIPQEIENSGATPSIAHCLVGGSGGSGGGWNATLGIDGGGNLDADPLFVDASAGNARVSAESPAIDAGDDLALPGGVMADMAGNPRIYGAAVDMGAFELQALVPVFVSQPLPQSVSAGGARGAAWADVDINGYTDLFVSQASGQCLLLRNDGLGGLTDAQAVGPVGSWSAAAWGEFTNDGHPDLYVSTALGSNILYWNRGPLGLVDATPPSVAFAGGTSSVTWVDVENDGDLDLYVCPFGGQGNRLYRNDGSSEFTEVTGSPLNDQGLTESAAWADYDDDGDVDVYLARVDAANVLLRNDGDGQFVDATAGPLGIGGWSTAAAWADFDNDGDLDLFVSSADGPNHLLRNDGGLGFVDATPPGLNDTGFTTGASWMDYDNDGWIDLYFANGYTPNRLFRNVQGEFLDVTVGSLQTGAIASIPAVADYDNDGDVDLFVASTDSTAASVLLRNDVATTNHWLRIDLHGTISNRLGVGARLRVVTADAAQSREIAAGYGYHSQDSFTAHFGLGQSAVVDTLEVRWPSGIRQLATGLSVDQKLTVVEDANSTAALPRAGPRRFALYPATPNPFNPTTTLRFELPAAERATLRVYDVAGRLVRTLLDEARPAGAHAVRWDGRGNGGAAVASGVYVARLQAGAAVRTVRLVLVR